MQYFVVMIDYGFQDGAHRGMEAIVKPEATRRQIIEEVRDVLSCDHRTLVHVKEIDGNYCCDVTDEMIAAAGIVELIAPFVDHQAARFDRAQDNRKNWVA